MAKLVIPEIILFRVLHGIVHFIRQDIENNSATPEKSVTYSLLDGLKLGRYDFYEEAKKVFSRKGTHPRALDLRLFFDAGRAHLPTIHLNLPSENQTEGGIGLDVGYEPTDFNEVDGVSTEFFTRAFDTQYNFMVTSDNTFEVVMIYNLLRGMIISYMHTLEFEGIRNPRLSGQDLQIYGEIVPENVFMRAITLSFMFEASAPSLDKKTIIESIQFEPEIIDPNG